MAGTIFENHVKKIHSKLPPTWQGAPRAPQVLHMIQTIDPEALVYIKKNIENRSSQMCLFYLRSPQTECGSSDIIFLFLHTSKGLFIQLQMHFKGGGVGVISPLKSYPFWLCISTPSNYHVVWEFSHLSLEHPHTT